MIYFSADIETNGLAAGIHSMISLGVAAIDMKTGEIVGTFKKNLLPLRDLDVDSDTMQWWEGFPEAYKRATEGAEFPSTVMKSLEDWVKSFGQDKPLLAAWKPGFDCAFIRYYLFLFLGHDLFGRAGSGLDIKTLTSIALGIPFTECQIAKVPLAMKGTPAEHSHDALEDAVEQAHVMYNAYKKLGFTF